VKLQELQEFQDFPGVNHKLVKLHPQEDGRTQVARYKMRALTPGT
jgi:hypothetical protein